MLLNAAFCTSFSAQGYNVYGERFLRSYRLHSCGIPLYVYSEDDLTLDDWVSFRRLGDDPDYVEFVGRHGRNPIANGLRVKNGKTIKLYQFDAVRFCHKVFAKTQPPDVDWWIWIDADVELTADLDKQFFDQTCPGGYIASYLGRTDWSHSECGFVAYNLRQGGREFLRRLRLMYVEGLVFGLNQWDDSFVWDVVRKSMESEDKWFKNLSEGKRGLHVWPETILGEYSEHRKGVVAKKEIYGSIA